MKKIVCNGVRINCQMTGEGSDVVLLHGLAANHAFWRLNVLMTLARQHRVTVFDLRGHGYSDMPEHGYTTADLAGDLRELLTHLGIEKAHLVGHSLGGAVALHAAVLYPEKVMSLTVADSRVRALQPTNYAKAWCNWESAGKKLKELGLDIPEDEAESGLWILERLAAPEWQAMQHALKGTPLFGPFGGLKGGRKAAERWLQLMRSTSARQEIVAVAGLTAERIAEIRQPALLMYGECSPTMPSLEGLRRCLPHSAVEVIPEAGHFYPLSMPERFVSTLSRFLEAGQTQ